jgi:hypothetical protein
VLHLDVAYTPGLWFGVVNYGGAIYLYCGELNVYAGSFNVVDAHILDIPPSDNIPYNLRIEQNGPIFYCYIDNILVWITEYYVINSSEFSEYTGPGYQFTGIGSLSVTGSPSVAYWDNFTVSVGSPVVAAAPVFRPIYHTDLPGIWDTKSGIPHRSYNLFCSPGGALGLKHLEIGAISATLDDVANVGRIFAERSLSLGVSHDSAPTRGLLVSLDGVTTQFFLARDYNVAHGMLGYTATDVFAKAEIFEAAVGGLLLTGLKDSGGVAGKALTLRGLLGEAADTTKSTAGIGIVSIDAAVKSGSGATTAGANENLLTVRSYTTTRFILDADGDSHQDVGTAWTNFDAEDDTEILDALAIAVAREEDPIRLGITNFIENHRETLERLRLVSFNENGHHFVNMSRLTMLLVGAVRQQSVRLASTERRLLEAGI